MADNFLKKTIKAVKARGYDWPDDIAAIQSQDLRISVDRFEELASVTHDGRGAARVAADLMIIMNDGGWFYRTQHVNSMVWEYAKSPVLIDRVDDDAVRSLSGQGWERLLTIQRYLG